MWEAVTRAAAADSGAPPCSTGSTRSTSCTARPGSTTTRSGGCASGSASTPDAALLLGHRRARRRRCWCRSRRRGSLRGELDVALVVGRRGARHAAPVQEAGRAVPVLVQARRSGPVPVGGAVPPGRGRARGLPGVADVRAVRQRAARSPRDRARRVPPTRSASSGTGSPRSPPRTRRPGSRSSGAPTRSSRRRPTTGWSAYPYTKYMISIMDVDMAAAVILVAEETADALGVPRDRRVYLRGWQYATDPVYVAEHPDLWRRRRCGPRSAPRSRCAGVGHRRRRAPRPVLVLRVVGELHARRARASAPTTPVRSPSPAACRTTVARAATTSPTRSRRWCGCCAPIPGRSGWSPGSGCT